MSDSTSTDWAAGRYEAVGERIAGIASQVVAAVDRRHPLGNATVVDLACGTGSAALAAAALGAQVTAVDLTAELVAIAQGKPGADAVRWVVGDAAHTGLATGEFDAAVSNMGIIFVEPDSLVAEVSRLLRPGGILGFSSWIPDADSPFFTPIVETLGPPPASGHSPDQWGRSDVLRARLSEGFEDITIGTGSHTWLFESLSAAMAFLTNESPMHVNMLGRLDDAQRAALLGAFESAFGRHVEDTGHVVFDSPYLIATARRS
ncbi:class I SAM-dependent methyltransferase [Mycolicibacterium brisbanense]|uniref:Type 11 methyltransferase n=1 Tax=Mycolicibacterium brisbanense TaxID=146020 RepID=A0A100W578_9MYCO|nr:class I SAM-dependent methyltransferase [Mycolicibacterium brisbanense]MCV7155988.1 class I SAM-dependent methyltransferase [Mycolicibacterium brisbanense]GAS91837.1 type 11 methyltransferase [Mycolicibacterium brisbanense]